MSNKKTFLLWLAQVRANFLLLAALLVAIGLAVSYKYQQPEESFNWIHAVMILVGVVSAHISVNLFNEYSDFKTKIDFNTKRTPFSGGSGILTQGLISPAKVLRVAVAALFLSLAIGIYFTITSHWSILVISLLGAFTIVYYTKFLTRYMLGEFFAGLTLGSLVVIGTYLAMNVTPAAGFKGMLPGGVVLISIPPGILTSLLLFLNEFPDAEADKKGGRKHLVIKFGYKVSAFIYTGGMIVTFGTIVLLPLLGYASWWLYIALLPLPLALKASISAFKFNGDLNIIIPALMSNVITVLTTDLLIAVGIVLDKIGTAPIFT
jgi:1,4-dihydroxy-2-naphthoate octaprenyltransferase